MITPGGALKVIKYASKASKGLKSGNLGTKAKKILKKADCGCFVAGTLVLTDGGYKKIEEIKKGDIVEFKPEYSDPGDEKYIFIAVNDEEKGRVDCISTAKHCIQPLHTVSTYMIERHICAV